LIGTSSGDANVGLRIAPAFTGKQSDITASTTPNQSDAGNRSMTYLINPTSGGLLCTFNESGSADGLPISISTKYVNAFSSPAIYVNTVANSERVGINSTTTNGQLHVKGAGATSGTWTAQFHNSGNANNALMVRDDGIVAMGTASPSASAKLEISSTTQGVLFPRMTTTQRDAISSAADGLVIYNTTDNKLQVRAAGAWVDLH
jgi:hypothetical protein